ncbi:hypothetical protein INT43_008733 [Umbelopsis isabellina]|uniref:proline--tRNA ligase n=1 Tax=Mortierella isabellina TaxID=91625 RepID=A0A8H7PW37_MORIS|nr:hypothetical protein INT43_008733 [Umbelopsis isabellina]
MFLQSVSKSWHHMRGVRCTSSMTPRNRLSKMFMPTSKEKVSASNADAVASHSLMLKAGFIRQSSSGIYSMLPMGLRTLEKIENVIDEEMKAIGGQRLALPLVLSSELWKKTGRWDKMGGELFKLQDRKESDLLLAPTHEEEITHIVANELSSYRQLPIRLFQIGRKYRDEMRPRSGLLRGREFTMKDLYTFDESIETASVTYDEVQGAYQRIFERIGVPFAVAEADTGNIGGFRSHEYHVLSSVGEDSLLTCPTCSYTANEEKAIGKIPAHEQHKVVEANDNTKQTDNVLDQMINDWKNFLLASVTASATSGKDNDTVFEETAMVSVYSHSERDINILKVQDFMRKTMENKAAQQGDFSQVNFTFTPIASNHQDFKTTGDLLNKKQNVHVLHDESLLNYPWFSLNKKREQWKQAMDVVNTPVTVHDLGDFRTAKEGDLCSNCTTHNISSQLVMNKAIEVAHTFLLGTRYSKTLDCSFTPREPVTGGGKLPVQMGCYGIGVSRLAASVIESLHDERGMVWPTSIAPYRVCILVADTRSDESNTIADDLYDQLNGQPSVSTHVLSDQVILDDRKGGFGFKIRDAEMIGYPFVVIVGKKTLNDGKVEIKERRSGQESHQVELSIQEAVSYLKTRITDQLTVK